MRLSLSQISNPNLIYQFKDIENISGPVTLELTDGEITIPIRHAIIHFIYWRNLIFFNLPIKLRHVIFTSGICSLDIISKLQTVCFNDMIDAYPDKETEIVQCLFDTINFNNKFILKNLTKYHSSLDIFEMSRMMRDEKVKEVVNVKLDPLFGTDVIEKTIAQANEEFCSLLEKRGSLTHNPLIPFMEAKLLNKNQLMQIFIALGVRTDVNDMIVTYPVTTSVFEGMKNIWQYAVESLSSKKSKFYNAVAVRTSQYVNRKQQLSQFVIERIYKGSCGTDVTVTFHITPINYKHLEGKIIKNEDGSEIILTNDILPDYIGKTVQMYSPITCRYTDGYCEKCGGMLTRFLPKELNNTLKDWQWVYAHTPTSSSGSCTIYGNYNHIALGETFPYILTESKNYSAPTLPDSSATAINSHTTLFGNPVISPENCNYQFRFFDISITGNQGVLETDQRNEETGLLEGGLLLTKFKNNLLFNNTVVNNFFTINVNDGPGSKNSLGEDGYQPTTSIKDSKMFDCFSTMLFNYSESKTEVKHSILSNSGGFLFINQANPYGDSNNKSWYGTDPSKIKGTIINIDETTILDNYVTGQGGWFQIYGAQSAIGLLKSLINPGFKKYGKTFTKAEGDYELFNAIALNMNSSMESAEPLGSGMVAQINIGEDISIDTTGNKEKVDTDYKSVNPSDPMTMLGFAQDLYNTEYGALYFSKLMTQGFLFKTHGTNDLYLAPADNQMNLSPVVNLISGAIKQEYPEYASILDTIITPVNDLKNYSDFKDSKYLTIYIDITAATSIQSEAAPRAGVNELITGYANFTGTNSYGLIVELLDE